MKRFVAVLVIVCIVMMSVDAPPTTRAALTSDDCQDAGSLCAMLNLLPDLLNDPSGSYNQVDYDNYAEHLRHFGFTAPTTFEGQDWDNFLAVAHDFVGAGGHFTYLRFWEENMGYSPFVIDQAVSLQNLPDSITLLRGRFDRPSVESFWSLSGYTSNSVNGTQIWKLRGDYENDLRDGSLRGLSRYNYAIFLQEDVIAYSSTAIGITSTLQTATGIAPALSENDTVVQLLAKLPAEIASAVLGTGQVFTNSSAWTLFGITPGGPARSNVRTGEPGPIPADIPSKRAYAALVYGPGVDVSQKANQISNTFLSGSIARYELPYTDFYQDLNVTVDPENDVVSITYTPKPDNFSNLFTLVLNGDLSFLV